jgi:EC042_2821-lke REase
LSPVADTTRFLSRAAGAKRSSKRVALREGFDPDANGDWIELVRDVAALANSGGGVIVLEGVPEVDVEELHEQLERYADPEFEDFHVEHITKNGRPTTAVVIEGAVNPLVFSRSGRHGRDHVAFARGGVYFRHGAKSEPATGADVRDFIERQLDDTRALWLANIRRVMHAPGHAEIAVVETAERDEEGRPTLIRLTTDPHAPLYGQVDPDQSHPYRQKEVIREVNARLDGMPVNAFDVLSVRRVYAITEETRPEFVHVPKFGSPQYSDAFVDWIVAEHQRDPEFFPRAKQKYLATRPRRRSRADSTP